MKETISLNIQISECRNSIMGVPILSIMLFHQYFISMIPFNFFHKFGYWGVDIFLFISGMGLVNSLKKNTKKDYYKRRFIRIIPSCLLCGTTKYIVFILFYSSLFILKDGLKIGIWSIASLDLWYIHTIIILYIISPIIFKSLNKNKYLTIAIILFLFLLNGIFLKPIVDYDWLSPKGIISWTIERLPVFTLGMYLSIYNRITNNYIYIFIPFIISHLFKPNRKNTIFFLWYTTMLIIFAYIRYALSNRCMYLFIKKHSLFYAEVISFPWKIFFRTIFSS